LKFENFDVVDDTDAKDENNILLETPTTIYARQKKVGLNLKLHKRTLK
jgi:outer membrane protein